MGRPTKHSSDAFIDAAIEIFADSGLRAVTLQAVAERVGASNGSIYHRFGERPSLLASMWLRAAESFESAFRDRLHHRTIETSVEAAAWVVDWCRQNPAEAHVLNAGEQAFGPDSWPAEARSVATSRPGIHAEISGHADTLHDLTTATHEQIVFTLVDLPLAVVRRSLRRGERPPSSDVTLVRELAAAILRPQAATR